MTWREAVPERVRVVSDSPVLVRDDAADLDVLGAMVFWIAEAFGVPASRIAACIQLAIPDLARRAPERRDPSPSGAGPVAGDGQP